MASLQILDPERRWFGNRIFTRFDGQDGIKSINRIFPYDKKMVLIVDDSEQAWPGVLQSCIKAHPYYFFVDPKAQLPENVHPEMFSKAIAATSAFCRFCPPEIAHIVRRPPGLNTRLPEGDSQLPYLSALLTTVHRLFFRSWRRLAGCEAGSLSIHSQHPGGLESNWADSIPNAAFFLNTIRESVLAGLVLSTTGVKSPALPLFGATDLGWWTTKFGARILEEFDAEPGISPTITHLLCNGHTDRLRRAVKLGIHTPHLMWLEKALYSWRRPTEAPFEYGLCAGKYRCLWNVPTDDNIEELFTTEQEDALIAKFFGALEQPDELEVGCDAEPMKQVGASEVECTDDDVDALCEDFLEEISEGPVH
eukprot:GHVS01106339.1.p1 GENE.GHVS01106339.1~~GHVS01106339.1.p1  ORF type:complete len:400 (-),score=19.44 GHVS01106339.1:63-1157(-)